MSQSLVLASTSRAEDAGYLAIADAHAVAAAVSASYRIVGGHMVALLVNASGVIGLPARETADADLGTTFAVVSNPNLVVALEDRGYTRPGAANRFERSDGPLPLAIDVLAPSSTGRLEVNRQHGSMVVDEIPGLSFALQRAGVELDLEIYLTDGRTIRTDVVVPEPVAALCLKAMAYGSRYLARDALDLWRLLEVAYQHSVRAANWPTSATPTDAARVLHRFFNGPRATGLRDVSSDRSTQTRVRALVTAVVRAP